MRDFKIVNESITAFFKGPAPFRSVYLSCMKAFIFFLLCITDRSIWIGGGGILEGRHYMNEATFPRSQDMALFN